ncbi:MAG TPA: DinB family protein [Longimicrobiaceae bacterium]|nr:DinB family protein [Longimicrobiaceae bacterium]
MDPIDALLDEIRRSVHGGAWHGPALGEALADASAAEAAARPLPGVHSIGEIALHAAGWMEEVAHRLAGGAPALPARGDWPAGPEDEVGWERARGAVEAAHAALAAVLRDFPPGRLEEPVGGVEGHDPPLGTGLPYAAMLHGVAQHNAYHAGQVILLKQALRAGLQP